MEVVNVRLDSGVGFVDLVLDIVVVSQNVNL